MNTCMIVRCQQSTSKKEVFEYIQVNEKLNNYLISWKNKIDDNKSWDTAKRLHNTYEFIFSSGYSNKSVSKKKPLSRSYFKLWEILHDFELIPNQSKTAHIAEGPGGFIECLCDFTNTYNKESQIFGITLKSNNKKIPSWKIPRTLLDGYNINLYDEDDGNIYDIHTVNRFINYVGLYSCDLVTSDGGFDFSADFNNQEVDSLQLMISEIYIALMIQKLGGSMIIKVFDLFCLRTIKLISLCSDFYENFMIIKPQTSRPANSEKYILFHKFDFQNTKLQQIYLELLKTSIIQQDLTVIDSYASFYNVLIAITKYNIYYTSIQVYALKRTLELSQNVDNYKKNDIICKNIKICKEWCKAYNIATY